LATRHRSAKGFASYNARTVVTEDFASQWSFPPGVTYLNHGSFGPPPRCVREARQEFQRRLDNQPMDFFLRQLPGELLATRRKLAEFVGCDADDLVMADNATTAMNIVAATVELRPGDQVLCNNHEYGAVLRLWERVCGRTGAKLVVADLPPPLRSVDELVDAMLSSITSRTRLLVFSHVTSPTAVVFPAAQVCKAARQREVAVCIDGPHAVAMLPFELRSLDCDFYCASCHKWLSAGFGSGFLYVNPRWHPTVRPAIVSWGRTPLGEEPSWRDEFHWLGTRDPSAWLSVTAAIEFLQETSVDDFRRRTHELACYARWKISELTGLEPLVADDAAWYGSMITLPLPPGEAEPLQRAIWEVHGIEVPVIDWPPDGKPSRRWIRVSCHLYNDEEQINRLAGALRGML
jgi:isopenicillin-N epimerase